MQGLWEEGKGFIFVQKHCNCRVSRMRYMFLFLMLFGCELQRYTYKITLDQKFDQVVNKNVEICNDLEKELLQKNKVIFYFRQKHLPLSEAVKSYELENKEVKTMIWEKKSAFYKAIREVSLSSKK